MSLPAAAGWDLVRALGSVERWLAVLVTSGPGAPSVSVVNAGMLAHPVTGSHVLGFVARGATAKLANLRRIPEATLVFRAGWEWVAVRGHAELAGPDDHLPGVADARVAGLLRDVYAAAGGVHHDLDAYDRVMADERRTAVLLNPVRFTTNPPGTEHEEP